MRSSKTKLLQSFAWIGLLIVLGGWQSLAWAETDCNAVTEIPTEQCEALVALYDSTDGDNWKDKTDWKQTNTPCSWKGIVCSDGQVTEINLFQNRLKGNLPDLSNLTNLQKLHLLRNQLSGDIPDLSSLTVLTYLNLGDNQLSGSVPDLSNLTALKTFYVHSNQLTNLPDLRNLTALQSFGAYSNELNGHIPNFINLPALRSLSLGNNKLSGTIPDLSALTNLQTLELNINQLTGNIPNLSALTNLSKLDLGKNQLTGNIPDLSNLTALRILKLHNNQLTGSIPTLNSLVVLVDLDLSFNKLTGSIPDFSTLTTLQNLYLHHNQLSGNVPDLSSLTALKSFSLANDTLDIVGLYNEGSLLGGRPDAAWYRNGDGYFVTKDDAFSTYNNSGNAVYKEDSYFVFQHTANISKSDTIAVTFAGSASGSTNLVGIDILLSTEGNNWTLLGTTPQKNWLGYGAFTVIGNPNIQGSELYVKVSPNSQVTGAMVYLEKVNVDISPSLCVTQSEIPQAQCETLVALYDSTDGENWTDNTGWKETDTPCSWFGVTCADNTITRIDVRENNLVGTLPSLSALPDLTYLYLFDNQLSGSIPDLNTLTELVYLRLHTNQLTGTIPNLSSLTNLQVLYLAKNKLTGTIPNLSTMTKLQTLYLHENQLTGSIPDLSILTQLEYIYLYANQLSGAIPDLSALTQLKRLHLYKNALTGTIPNLSSLTQLEFLTFGTNQLTGTIPNLSTLTKLIYLSFAANQLSGTIPNEVSTLTNLQVLTLHDNEFTGLIPDLSGLTKLTDLRLSKNQLTGPIPDVSEATNLQYLYLHNNNLYGEVPSWISSLTQLIRLYLNNNEFSGPVPDLSALTSLEYFTVYNTELCKNSATNYGDWTDTVQVLPICGNPAITLTSPIHSTTDIPISGQTFTWNHDSEASAHRIVISTQADFSNFTDTFYGGDGIYCNDTTTCVTQDFLTTASQTYTTTNLSENTTYYWKVRASRNPTFWSEIRSFTTGDAPKTGCNGNIQLSDNLCDGLTLYMPFDGNAKDESGNGNDGTVNGATLTTDRFNNTNGAYSLNGEDSYLKAQDAPLLDLTENFTISAWVKKTGLWSSQTHPVIVVKNPINRAYLLWVNHDNVGADNADFSIRVNINGPFYTTRSGVIPEMDTWYFVTGIRKDNSLEIYINGELRNTTIIPDLPISITEDSLNIGGRLTTHSFNGLIDDVTIHNRALTASEIQSHYDSSKPATTGCNGNTQLPDNLCEGLVAYYPLDSNPNDASGNGNDGTEYNVNYTDGVIGKAVSLDGTGYIRKENFNFTTQDFSVATWMKASSLPDYYRHLFAIHSGGGGTGHGDKAIHLYHHRSGNAIRGILTTEDGRGLGNDANHVTATIETNIQENQWYHIAFVRQSITGLQKLYVDGVNVNTITERNVDKQFFVENGFLEIGAPNYYQGGWTTNSRDTAKWQGLLDEMYLYNRTLSDAEIQSLYNVYSPITMLEDAEDGDTTGWTISGEKEGGAAFSNVFDDERNSKVIEFTGDPRSGYKLVKTDSTPLSTTNFIARWNIKIMDGDTESPFVSGLFWRVKTTGSVVYLEYRSNRVPLGCHLNSSGAYAICNLGNGLRDGTWHTITRDLEADLKTVAPELEILEVDHLQVNMAGRIDDIQLLNQNAVNFHAISGTITKDNQPVSGKSLSNTGADCQLSDSQGNFTCSIPEGWYGSLTPKNTNEHYFTPLTRAYSKISEDIIEQDFTIRLIADGLEDAEDGEIDGWSISANPSGDSAFANVVDNNKDSRVIEFTGNSRSTYQFVFPDGTPLSINRFVARWDINMATGFGTVFWRVKTTGSVTYMEYRMNTPLGCHLSSQSTYAICGTGDNMQENTWYTITRDIKADLKTLAPNIELQSVEYMLVHTAGSVDNVKLLEEMPIDAMLEDAEDGDTNSWFIYDEKTDGGATLANIFDNDKNSQVIELAGNSFSGYKLSFDNSTNSIARWSMKSDTQGGHTIAWNVKTNGSVEYIQYRSDKPLGCHVGANAVYLTCGLSDTMRDGDWHTITRDLEADLKAAAPELELQEVVELRIRMAGRLDDIQLLHRDNVTFHTISGKFVNVNDKGLTGKSIANSGADCQDSDSEGNYQCTVPEGWFGTLTPDVTAIHFFTPITLDYSNVSANITEQDFTRQTIYHGLLGYWNFDNCDASDNSGNGFDGIVHSEPNCVDGVRGKGFKFDGTDDFIEINGGEVLSNPVITTAAWVYKTADVKGRVLEKIDNLYRNGDNYILGVRGGITENRNNGQDLSIYSELGDEYNDQWIHTTFVLTTKDISVYINGEFKTKKDLPEGFVPYMGNAPLQIGGTPLSDHGGKMNAFFNSIIDEVYVYNRALSDAEILQLANPNRVVAHYCFDDPDNLANDCGGNGLHGILNNHTDEYQAGLADGNAIEVDGVDDWMNIGTVKPNFMRQAFTIATRFKTHDIEKARQVIIWFRDDHPSIGIGNGNVYFGFRSSGNGLPRPLTDVILESHTPHATDWNCAVYTYDASDERIMRAYLNGVQVQERTLESDYMPSYSYARIGLDDNGARRFQGLIDDVQIHNRAWTEEEIADYQSLCPPMEITSELVLEDAEDGDTQDWSFYSGEGEITNTVDETGNNVIEFTKPAAYTINKIDGKSLQVFNKPIVQFRTKGSFGTTYWYTPYKVAQVTSARLGCHFQSQWNETFCGIDVGIRDGEWHTVTRDVAADLHEVFPDADMSAITRLSIRSSGQIDDIKFISRDAINFYTISGNIALDGNALSGVKLTGGGNCQPSDDNGNFQCSVPQDWFGSLVPKKEDYIFEPFSLVYENIASDQTANIIAKPIPTSEDEPVLHWTRDMHPITGNGAVKLPNWFEDYVDDEYTVTISATPTASKANNYLFYVSQAYIATDKDYPSIKLDTENRVQFKMADEVITSEPIPLNETIQVAITWNGADFTGYVNGKVIGSLSIENYKYGSLTLIGWNANTGDAFEGTIHEVKIYKKAITFLCSDVEEIPFSQCQTLVDLYENTDGDNWANKDGWNVSNTPCSWYGVECTDGNLTKISLENNSLNGTIPDLSNLTELMDLRLFSNELTGNIPELNALTKLEILFLNDNQLNDTIPQLDNLTALQRVYLSHNQLSGSIPELNTLTQLQQIDVLGNKLTGAIPDLSSLTALTNIGLIGNLVCQDTNVDYAGHIEVAEFPICGNQSPIAIIAEPIIDGNTVKLDGNSSNDPDPDGTIVTHIWTTDESQIPIIGTNPTIEFTEEGEHSITLTVIDDTGLTTTITKKVIVGDIIEPEPPQEGEEPPIEPDLPPVEEISLTINKRGTGTGIISLNGSIECTEICGRHVENYDTSTEVELQVVPSSDSIFIGWGRNCGKTTELITTVTVDRKLKCTAYFDLDPTKQHLHRVRAIKIGEGYGDVVVKTLNNVVINTCSTSVCEAKFYATDTEIELTARDRTKSTFIGWGEDCIYGGDDKTITLTIDKSMNCTAQFDLKPPEPGQQLLTVSIGPDNISPVSGHVVSGSNINCGYDCKEVYNQGKEVKLIAVPDPHSYFVKWEDDCEGTFKGIKITMDSDKTCKAIFGSNSDLNTDLIVEEFIDVGELVNQNGEDYRMNDVFPSIYNETCYQEAYRLAENAMQAVEEQYIISKLAAEEDPSASIIYWPEHFKVVEKWFTPSPSYFCTNDIRIMSGKELIGGEYVEGDFIQVNVELKNVDQEYENVSILVYYDEEPIITPASTRARCCRRKCRHRRWRPRWWR